MHVALPSSRAIPPILHYSAGEPFTKYEMCLVFARLLGVPHSHITPDAEAPKVCRLRSRCYRMLICAVQGDAASPASSLYEKKGGVTAVERVASNHS